MRLGIVHVLVGIESHIRCDKCDRDSRPVAGTRDRWNQGDSIKDGGVRLTVVGHTTTRKGTQCCLIEDSRMYGASWVILGREGSGGGDRQVIFVR